MAFQDMREYLDKLADMGDVKYIKNADWDLEIGAISEMLAERNGPALVFDEIIQGRTLRLGPSDNDFLALYNAV